MIKGKYFTKPINLSNMKKVLLQTALMLIMFMSSMLTLYATPPVKANPYVKWSNKIAPKFGDPNQIFTALQLAARGQNSLLLTSYKAETVFSNVDAYQTVWTKDLWEEVSTADLSQFDLEYSSGGEINYGIIAGKAVPLDPLAPGVPIVIFTRKSGQKVKVAKWGTNGCLNAMCEYIRVDDALSVDPDTDPGAGRRVPNPKVIRDTVYKETVIKEKKETTWEEGYGIYKTGQYDTYVAQMKAMDLAQYSKMLQNNNSCGCGSTNTTTVTTPMFATTAAMPAQPMYYQQPRRLVETFGGQVLANGLGTALGIGIVAVANRAFVGRAPHPVYYGGGVGTGGIPIITTGGPVSPQGGFATVATAGGGVIAPTLGVPTPGVFTPVGAGTGGFGYNP